MKNFSLRPNKPKRYGKNVKSLGKRQAVRKREMGASQSGRS